MSVDGDSSPRYRRAPSHEGAQFMDNLGHSPLLPNLQSPLEPSCHAFSRQWRQGLRPVLEAYLEQVPESGRDELAAALIRIELQCRFRLGEQPSAESYRGRFPAHAASIETWIEEARAGVETAS